MEVWFAKKTYTAMAVQAVVGATALANGRNFPGEVSLANNRPGDI